MGDLFDIVPGGTEVVRFSADEVARIDRLVATIATLTAERDEWQSSSGHWSAEVGRLMAANRAVIAERDAAREEARRLREAAAFPRNVWIGGDGGPNGWFTGQWIAVPKADFDALRAALAAAVPEGAK